MDATGPKVKNVFVVQAVLHRAHDTGASYRALGLEVVVAEALSHKEESSLNDSQGLVVNGVLLGTSLVPLGQAELQVRRDSNTKAGAVGICAMASSDAALLEVLSTHGWHACCEAHGLACKRDAHIMHIVGPAHSCG